MSDISDVSNVVINNNPVSSIINNNNNNNSESDDVSFNLSHDEDTTDTEEILVSEEKNYKVESSKHKLKIIETVNKANNKSSKIAKVLVEDADEDNDRNDISDKMSVYSRRVIRNAASGMDSSNINSGRTTNLSVFSAKMHIKNISAPDIQSQKEVSKIKKKFIYTFYTDSYYMVIYIKTNYFPDENYFSIYAN
jgi:dGTP triphosphohydrolase